MTDPRDPRDPSEKSAGPSNVTSIATTINKDDQRVATFTLPADPSPSDVIQFMKAMGRFLGLTAADLLRAGVFTAGHPASMALLNAAGGLEGTAEQWAQYLQQQQAAASMGGQRGVPMPMGPGGPMRFN